MQHFILGASARSCTSIGRRRRRVALALAPLAFAALGVTACSSTDDTTATGSTTKPGSSAAPGGTTGGTTTGTTGGTTAGGGMPTLTIAATEEGEDYLFDIPENIETGWQRVVLDNSAAKLPHQVNIGRLRDGVTEEQVKTMLEGEEPTSAAALVAAWIGGPNNVPASEQGTGYINFDEPGKYVALCFLSSPPDMEEHVTHGMWKVFDVADSGKPAVTEPEVGEVAGTIDMQDFEWFLPDDFTGKGLYKLTDTAEQPHEIAVYALEDGKTKEDVLAVFAGTAPPGPPPFSDAGGFGAISKGNDAYMDLDLAPGRYLLVCFLPDAPPPRDLQPHFTHGMIKEITIE